MRRALLMRRLQQPGHEQGEGWLFVDFK